MNQNLASAYLICFFVTNKRSFFTLLSGFPVAFAFQFAIKKKTRFNMIYLSGFGSVSIKSGNSSALRQKSSVLPSSSSNELWLLPFRSLIRIPEVMAAEPSGRLKVIIIQGKNLVIRDFRTSDPYVVVKLGTQKAKTKVICSNLNPVWNEELNFTIGCEPTDLLNFEVYDKDLFKRDDKMGRASFNLQPMQSASRLRKILGMSAGETSLRKVVPGKDDCLKEEYCVRCVDGELVQDVWLRLRGVESGEIQVRIIYVEENINL